MFKKLNKTQIGSDNRSLTHETAGVNPCPILSWLLQPAKAGSAYHFFSGCILNAKPGLLQPANKQDIQPIAAKPAECWNVCYALSF